MHAARRERGVLSLFVLLLLAFPFATRAAELTFSPTSGSFATGEEFSIKVQVNPGSDSVNAADGTLSFDSTTLSVASISKEGSAFSLWTAEPEFSNSAGTVTFSGGTPTAFSTLKAVLTVNFTAKKAGSASLTFTKGSILAADGKGTDVYVAGEGATYTITEGTPAGDEEASEEDASAALPAPAISSVTHPKEDLWYSTSTVEYSWKMPSDATGVRTIFSDKEDEKPDFVQKEDVTSERLVDIADGVWYAFAQFQSDLGWGEIGRRAFKIDTTPPAEFDFALVEGDTPKLSFQAEDSLSGIDKYEILFSDAPVGALKGSDAENGFTIPAQDGGLQKVTVKAFDKAGNVREASKEIELPKVAKAKSKAGEEEEEPSFFTVERILLILFAMAIGALVTLNVYARRNAEAERSRILHEVALVRDKNDKVFSAMREEFEQMVNDFDVKPQLTPDERNFLENIKEALDISEEVVDSSMEELKKTIRDR